jgi:hypothetical protein
MDIKLFNSDYLSDNSISEKDKLKYMNTNNINVLNRLEKFIELLNKIEASVNEKAQNQLIELIEIQLEIKNCDDIFRTICSNLVKF